MPAYIAYFNGKFVSEDRIAISPNDRGFLYGDGVFETMRAVKGGIISFHAHIERLKDGCQRTGLRWPFTNEEPRVILHDLLQKNALKDAYVRITITRGIGEQFGFGYAKDLRPTLLVAVRPIKDIPAQLYEKGVKIDFAISSLFGSHDHESKIKSLSAQPFVMAKQSALDQGCYETVFMDALGHVYEGSSSNLFIIEDGTLYTPPIQSGILPGTTRARVVEIAKSKLGLSVFEAKITKAQVLSAEEVFLTNTNIQILPVNQAGTKKIGNGAIGPVTRRLLDVFRQTLIEILE